MFMENVIEFRQKRPTTENKNITAYELGICQRCHRKISLMKMHQHPMSVYCSNCEREAPVRSMQYGAGPLDLCAMAV